MEGNTLFATLHYESANQVHKKEMCLNIAFLSDYKTIN